jgi:uncharacterized membrane protein YkvA (DUF1232 family)
VRAARRWALAHRAHRDSRAYDGPMPLWSKFWRRANTARLATHLLALWKLFRHPDTPRPAKLVALLVLAYALSPIDLIPDFIPVLGWIDDLILLPLGIALAVRMTPRQLWLERVAEAEQGAEKLPRLMWGAIIVVAVWLLVLWLVAWGLVTLVTSGA